MARRQRVNPVRDASAAAVGAMAKAAIAMNAVRVVMTSGKRARREQRTCARKKASIRPLATKRAQRSAAAATVVHATPISVAVDHVPTSNWQAQ